MHLDQVGARVDPVFAHQPGQRGAVSAPVMPAQVIGAGVIHAKLVHDEVRHAPLDLVEQARLRRVQGVVEVEDPRIHMGEFFTRHGANLLRRGAAHKAGWLDCAGRTGQVCTVQEREPRMTEFKPA